MTAMKWMNEKIRKILGILVHIKISSIYLHKFICLDIMCEPLVADPFYPIAYWVLNSQKEKKNQGFRYPNFRIMFIIESQNQVSAHHYTVWQQNKACNFEPKLCQLWIWQEAKVPLIYVSRLSFSHL